MKIIKDEKHLNKVCIKIDDYKTNKQIANKMIMFMLNNPNINKNSVGLACNQIGLNGRVIIVKINNKWKPFINPLVFEDWTSNSMEIEHQESCLSIPKKQFSVKRNTHIKVIDDISTNKNPNYDAIKYSGFIAMVIQHEIDHLNGILIKNKG